MRKSLVLLKNENDVLPLAKSGEYNLLVAGHGADNIGWQCGGWTACWQGKGGPITKGTSIWDAIQTERDPRYLHYSATADFRFELVSQDNIGLLVVSERPYAEGLGDREDVRLPDENCQLIHKMKSVCSKVILLLVSGRPLIIPPEVLEKIDGFVIAWLPGSEGEGIADLLFGRYPFTGKLATSYPRSEKDIPLAQLQNNPDGALFPRGFGLTTESVYL